MQVNQTAAHQMLTHYSSYPSHRLPTTSAMASPAKHDNTTTVTGGPVGSVAVVGAGVSGLAAAYKLKSNGFNVTVFEAEPRVGGKIRSGSQDGFIWDEGANTMTETESEVGWLIDDIDLREKQQFPISQHKRYVAKNGIPEMLPSNPIALIKSKLLSTKAKFQILMEPFMWKKGVAKVSCEHSEESVGQFFQRHFGKEVVDLLIDPFLAGTNGGDPESLSIRHTFPELWKLESMFGSVIFGAIRSKFSHRSKERTASGGKKVQRGSFSFLGGMDTLTNTLCSKLDDDELNLCSKVLSLSCDYDGNPLPKIWSITSTSKNTNKKQHSSFDAVIMTAPISNVQDMSFTKGGSPLMLNFLPKVDYVPLSVIVTSFSKYKVKRPLEGFGVLVPSREQENGLRTLGTLFSSMMFPDRAPSNQHLYTTFIGGSRSRDLAGASLDELKQIVISDLQKLLGTEGQPTFVKHIYWKNAFPLYGHNYSLVLEGINKMEEALPGFYYAGNHRDGLSVGKAIASGCRAADNAISYILSSDKQQDTQKSE